MGVDIDALQGLVFTLLALLPEPAPDSGPRRANFALEAPLRRVMISLGKLLPIAALLVMFGSVTGALAQAVAVGETTGRIGNPGDIHKSRYTNKGELGLTITNLGYVGNGFDPLTRLPSGRYPLNSKVEHLFLGGIWVGAVAADGTIHVSTGAQDASTLVAGDEIREFRNYYNQGDPEDPNDEWLDPDNFIYIWSNSQNADNYYPGALATQQFRVVTDDYARIESGNHTPLGLKVILRAMAWSLSHANDFVILDFSIINVSGSELRDVYVGFWNDTTVGNVEANNPYISPTEWNYYDDMNGAWGPEEWVGPGHAPDGDPNIWMMYEKDDDGDDGLATSWIGCRLLGTEPQVNATPGGPPPVSYNAWQFRHVPAQDDYYTEEDDPDLVLPGKYQIMSNGAFNVGETQEEDYTTATDWMGLLSTGPFPFLAPDDTLHVTFALTAGADSLSLLDNSKVAQISYYENFNIPEGPPSPILEFAYENNSVVLSWAPGDSLDTEGNDLPIDDPSRSPEHHISEITAREDFQGYIIYRHLGADLDGEGEDVSVVVAQFDKVDGKGFDTGLPPLNEEGYREFVDTDLADGFPYWYSVVSFSAPDEVAGLPAFFSGYNENSQLVYPGPAPVTSSNERGVGVYPNPYRAGSMFDSRTGQKEFGRKIWFTGLPARCTIQVFNLMGEVVKTIDHDDPVSGQESWDILSETLRAIATGLYIYAVENLDTGEVQRGKLVIIK